MYVPIQPGNTGTYVPTWKYWYICITIYSMHSFIHTLKGVWICMYVHIFFDIIRFHRIWLDMHDVQRARTTKHINTYWYDDDKRNLIIT